MIAVESPTLSARSFAVRMWGSCLATQELLTVYIGARLGLYEQLSHGPATVAELSRRCGVAERYTREWLEQQAVAGIIVVDDADAAAATRVYCLPEEHWTVLHGSDDPLSLLAVAVLPVGGIAQALPDLLAAYRNGDGVPDAAFGSDWREGHSAANRSLFVHQLSGWIRTALPDVHRRLVAPGARIADVACGSGWSSVALAGAYPEAAVHGVDADACLVEEARRHAEASGVGDRVRVVTGDAARGAGLSDSYHLICVFDALHELAHPVAVLRACRERLVEDGATLVMDAKVAARFTAPGDDVERFQYATSVLHCLPACLAAPDSAATGTVMRRDQVRDYAARAGFSHVTVLPVHDRFHQFYRLGT